MPYKAKPTEKLFYSIGETAKIFDVNLNNPCRFGSKKCARAKNHS